ncbi:MAG: translocation/assembly module TamB domain-containing protein [Saprospiraceae bacterium]|nr:translocation/assembly module TamB domain-containing protein [Saprospiraceae bacterium]
MEQANHSGSRLPALSRRIQEVLLSIIAFLLLSTISCILLVQMPPVQNYIKTQILKYVNEHYDQAIRVNSVSVDLVQGLRMDALILDHHQDTLLFAASLHIQGRYLLTGVIRKAINITKLEGDQVLVKLRKYPGETRSNLQVFLEKFKSVETSTSPVLLDIKNLNISDLSFSIDQDSLLAQSHFRRLAVRVDSMHLPSGYLNFRSVVLDEPIINIHLSKLQKSNDSAHTKQVDQNMPSTTPSFNFSFINCNKGSIRISQSVKQHIFELKEVHFTTTYLTWSEPLKKIEFLTLNALGNQDFKIQELHVLDMIADTTGASLRKLKLRTPKSHVELSGKVTCPSGRRFDCPADLWEGNLGISKGALHPADLRYLFGDHKLFRNFSPEATPPLTIQGDFRGTMRNFQVSGFRVQYGSNFSFAGSGRVRNIHAGSKALINFKCHTSNINSDFAFALLNNPSIPSSYSRLGTVNFNGYFDGFLSDFVAFGTFKTDLGVLSTDVKLALAKDIRQSTYSGSLYAKRFDLGKFLDIPNLGKLDASVNIVGGRGLTRESVEAQLTANLQQIEWDTISLATASFTGSINRGTFNGKLSLEDPRIQAELDGDLQTGEGFTGNLTTKVTHLDLTLFELKRPEAQISFSANVRFELVKNNVFNGFIDASDIAYSDSSHSVVIRELIFSQSDRGELRKMSLKSDFVTLEALGTYEYNELPAQVVAFLESKHPGLFSSWRPVPPSFDLKTWINGNIAIQDGHSLNEILQLEYSIDKLNCDINLNMRKGELDVRTSPFDVRYKNVIVRKAALKLTSSKNLSFDIHFDSLRNAKKLFAGTGILHADFASNEGLFKFDISDPLNKIRLASINVGANYSSDSLQLQVKDEALIFNNVPWKIHDRNIINFKQQQLTIRNFELSDSFHFISLRDFDRKGIVLETDGFSLQFVNDLLQSEKVKFYGIFNALITIPNLKDLTGSHGKISISDFTLNKSKFGTFVVGFSVPGLSLPWELNVHNQFQEHQVRGAGHINIPLSGKEYQYSPYDFSVTFNVVQFPLSFVENFIETVSGSTGGGDGSLRLYTENGKLNLEGRMLVAKASTFIDYLGVPVNMVRQNIEFKKRSIEFDSVILEDKLGNPLLANGALYHKNLKDWSIDMRVTSKYALVLDTDKNHGEDYYGYGIGSVDARFTGSFDLLQMDLICSTAKGSRIYLPMTTVSETERAEFVSFIQDGSDSIPRQFEKKDRVPLISGLNVLMQLGITEDAEVNVIFDELTGDVLRCRGRGNMLIKALRTGAFTVNGDFEIEQGQYLFTLYNFVNKPFTLTRGGLAVWTGDPYDANVNIEAVYEGLAAAPYLLLQEYISDNEVLTEEAKRRTQVKLKMMLTGSLLRPSIRFDLELPELTGSLKNYADNKIQYLKLNQEQFNQQVFGLLVLGTFLNSNNPWEGGLIGNIGTTTINTMSEMLSNQFSLFVTNVLNNALGESNFISGIDFNIGYDIDKTNVGGTDLNESEVVFSMKNRLWNDQWIITLGGNYKSNSQLLGTSYFNPESVIEWNTPVKGLKLRVYYRGDETIEGLKQKVGAGVSIRKEFDRLFGSSENYN